MLSSLPVLKTQSFRLAKNALIRHDNVAHEITTDAPDWGSLYGRLLVDKFKKPRKSKKVLNVQKRALQMFINVLDW